MTVPISLTEFEGVLFDVDGTLVDSIGMITAGLGDMYEKYFNIRPSENQLKSIIGLPLTAQVGMMTEHRYAPDTLEEAQNYAIERFKFHESKEKIFKPAVQALRRLHELGYGTCLVTSKSAIELQQFLERFPATEFITAAVCASEVQRPKPAADSACLACQKLGIQPSKALLIGDSIYDLQCARAANITAIGVAYGATSYETLTVESPDHVFHRPEELLAWVEQTATTRHATKEEFVSTT